MPDATDAQRRADLRRMKQLALGLLLLATAIFICARIFEDDHAWLGYVRAFAEAAMVGALADWFAVTALFRHPLGIPIPHTAIIPRRKDQIARSLGTFVEDNFMSKDVIHDRLREGQIGRRLGGRQVAARSRHQSLLSAAPRVSRQPDAPVDGREPDGRLPDEHRTDRRRRSG